MRIKSNWQLSMDLVPIGISCQLCELHNAEVDKRCEKTQTKIKINSAEYRAFYNVEQADKKEKKSVSLNQFNCYRELR